MFAERKKKGSVTRQKYKEVQAQDPHNLNPSQRLKTETMEVDHEFEAGLTGCGGFTRNSAAIAT